METFCEVSCHLQRAGQGDGVILLHGWGQDMRMMRLIQNELKSHYRVINLDLPASDRARSLISHGGSSNMRNSSMRLLRMSR